ncbi:MULTISPECIES: SAM-dependent methyltransferase [unclassified Kitasatospora]|uniref:SAM-dependent methyltransferase n=1 Tax=unclassified Kitasatospora TaxID=2633591 RepID=UPI0037FA7C3D
MGESDLTSRVNVEIPAAARMFDFLGGGTNNFPADRRSVEDLLALAPSSRELVIQSRAFLLRAVESVVCDHGITQILDHGSGFPAERNVHQVAQAVDRNCRVVYIDNDPTVILHSRALLDENENVRILGADIADPAAIRQGTEGFIDFDKPVAMLFVSVLHCFADDLQAAAIVRESVRGLPPGSVVVLCQLASDRADFRRQVTGFMRERTGGRWGRVRSRDDVADFFDGLDVQEPGLVDVSDWRPDTEVLARQRSLEWITYGGLAVVR